MATTPEGRVKAKIKKILKEYEPDVFYFMPVPGGYGGSSVDFIGVYKGVGFAIEAKANGKKPTPRQSDFLDAWAMAGGASMVIADTDDAEFEELRAFLRTLVLPSRRAPSFETI